MKKWRKRLNDLKQLITQAEATYFEPNLFRLNINNAIQTSRTVTFLIQKEKSSIPKFDKWYEENVLQPMADSVVMKWLRDARNTIEKEGDLETHSIWRARHLYSYTQDGAEITADAPRGLFLKLGQLRNYARSVLPKGIFNDSALIIDRKWVADTLPQFELIDAVSYGYKQLKEIVDKLDEYIGEIPQPDTTGEPILWPSQMRRAYLKLADEKLYNLQSDELLILRPDELALEKLKAKFGDQEFLCFDQTLTIQQRVSNLAAIGAALMRKDGHHITLCLLFNKKAGWVKFLSPQFEDHADKLIFWHELAYTAKLLEISSALFVSEAWQRDTTAFGKSQIADLPIVGESLHVIGAASNGSTHAVVFTVSRTNGSISLAVEKEGDAREFNILAPLRRAWGVTK